MPGPGSGRGGGGGGGLGSLGPLLIAHDVRLPMRGLRSVLSVGGCAARAGSRPARATPTYPIGVTSSRRAATCSQRRLSHRGRECSGGAAAQCVYAASVDDALRAPVEAVRDPVGLGSRADAAHSARSPDDVADDAAGLCQDGRLARFERFAAEERVGSGPRCLPSAGALVSRAARPARTGCEPDPGRVARACGRRALRRTVPDGEAPPWAGDGRSTPGETRFCVLPHFGTANRSADGSLAS